MSIVNELPAALVLKHGSHHSLEEGACVMEAVSYLAGESWSDRPECVCPVIGQFLRSWNDSLTSDDDRTRLLAPLIPKVIGTRGSKEAELARVMLVIDWSIREWLPTFLELSPACAESASALRALKPIQQWEDFDAAVAHINEAQKRADAARDAARDAAWGAAWDAARDAALDAALDAARDAAWGAARDAALDAARDAARGAAWGAARDAALDAARDAARDAVLDAARDAAWCAALGAAKEKLAPTVSMLQQSAVALVERMCALKEPA